MSELEAVNTRIGLSAGQIIVVYDRPVDTIAYGPDAAEEVANKLLELVKQVREGLTKD